MKVKTIADHANEYGVRDGGKYEKKAGDTYEVDDAAGKVLIAAGLVEQVETKAKDKA